MSAVLTVQSSWRVSRLLPLAALCMALGVSQAAPPDTPPVAGSTTPANHATSPAADAGGGVSLNFVNADIAPVIKAISQISGRNFVVDPRVKGTISVVTATPVPPEMTYAVLLSALRLQGYTAVEGKHLTKIVPEADAKLHSGTVDTPVVAGDQLVTRIFPVRNESAAQLVAVIRPLVSPNNTVIAYPGNNSLVVTDYADNIERISTILQTLDMPQSDVRVIPLRHAAATDMANTLNRMLVDPAGAVAGGGADNSQRLQIMADLHSNSLLVRSDNASKLRSVDQLVAQLDRPGAAGNIHVVYLKNAEAVRVAQVLRGVMSGAGGTVTAPTATPLSAKAAGSGGTAEAPTAGTSTVEAGPIQADPVSNSLIITAPDVIYHNLRRVIDQLDQRRTQLYIEALIVEVNSSKATDIGIQWQTGQLGSGSYAGTNFGSGAGNLLDTATNLASGATSGTLGNGFNLLLGNGTLSVGGTPIANLHMLARFLETDGSANILSTPNLVTLDNEEAKIVVGRNLPFITGQYSSTGGNSTVGSPFQTISRQDVGLTLRVKPQISEGGTVKLQIYQEASSLSSATVPGLSTTAGPVTNVRSIESTVLVDDGSVVVLGGLVEDEATDGEDKVPVLGDLPVLGGLFRHQTVQRRKANLMVFLRPVILRDAQSYQNLSGGRYGYILDQQKQPGKMLDGKPVLPALTAPAPAARSPAVVPEAAQ